MRRREDTKMGLRWIGARPVETLLLTFGIALGIGATAAGIALAGRAGSQARELLASTNYREIVVTAREEAADMDLPAEAQTATQRINLTTEDLSAAEDVPEVTYAYVANQTDLRFDGAFAQRLQENAAVPVSATAGVAAAGVEPARAAVTPGDEPPDMPGGMPSDTPGGMPPDMQQWQQGQQVELPEGPQPVLEEVRGYEVTPEFFQAWNMAAAQGSLFTTEDMKSSEPILVLGSTIGATLFKDSEALDRQVLARRELYRITGILEPTGTELDSMVFAPAAMAELQGLASVARMAPAFNTSLHFTVADYTRLTLAKDQLENWFSQKFGESTVVIAIPRAQAEAARDRNSRLVTVILFLALSALLIAAANVVNILFSRALRKRRAVGVLKALGASVQSVFNLFFLEALAISAAGAVAGAGLSILMSKLMQDTMGFGAIYVSLLAAGIVGAAGIVAALDIFPALQAARIPAAEAIRYE